MELKHIIDSILCARCRTQPGPVAFFSLLPHQVGKIKYFPFHTVGPVVFIHQGYGRITTLWGRLEANLGLLG